MSYSNNWSISGITGLTSLKDCYQWNGAKRLYNFGMLRLKDGDLNQDNEVWVDSEIFPNSTLIQYYSIPKFFITNKNVSGVGYGLPNTEEDSYKYSDDIDYPNNSNDNLKNWGFKQYPNIPYCAWVDPNQDVQKARSIVTSSTYIGLLADSLNSGSIIWKMFTEEPDGIREDTTLTIPNLERIYNAELGIAQNIKNNIANTGLDYRIENNMISILKEKSMSFYVNGWRVYKWGGSCNDSLMYGYIRDSSYPIVTSSSSNPTYYIYPVSSGNDRNYTYSSGQRFYKSYYDFNHTLTQYTYRVPTTLNRELVIFLKPRYRFYLYGDTDTLQIAEANNTTARNIGVYYDTEDSPEIIQHQMYHYPPIWHILYFTTYSGGLSDSDFSSDNISRFRGQYWDDLSSRPSNDFVVNNSYSHRDWSDVVCVDNSASGSVSGSTTETGTLTIPLLYDASSDNRTNQITRPYKDQTSLNTSGLFTYNGQSIVFPVFWSSEPKIWWFESIINDIVTYTLYFGNYKTTLTQNLMQLYGKDFEVKIYHSDQTTLLHTFTFSKNEFPTTNTSIKKEYRNGNSGCNLYLQNDYGYYRIYLTEVINGTEYHDSNHEFNKTYYLPWNTRATIMYNATVYVEKYSGQSGTLTGATVNCGGRTYTSTTIENGKVVFNLVITQLNQGFAVNSITTSDNYVLDTTNGVPYITVSEGINTCYIQTQYFGWNAVSNINVEEEEEGGYSWSTYTIDFPKGFVSTVQGTIYLANGTTISVNDNTSSSDDWHYTEPRDTSATYINLVLTAYDNTTRTRSYGTPQWTSETLSDETTTIGDHSYTHCYIYSNANGGIGIRGYADGHYFSFTNMSVNHEYTIYIDSDGIDTTRVFARMTSYPYRIYVYGDYTHDDGGDFWEGYGQAINLTNIEVQHW